MDSNKTIGVFDSGLGGLSVLQELWNLMPNEHYCYIGDNARSPYGPRSAETVARFTLEAADFLIRNGAKVIVIACNTATVAGLETARKAYPETPIIGVVDPGCLAAAEATRNGKIVLVATKGTVSSGAHAARLQELRPGCKVIGVPAPLFVQMIEEGWLDGDAVDAAARRYLSEYFTESGDQKPDCLILGCTHFPLIRESIGKAVGDDIALVDPASITAAQVQKILRDKGQLRETSAPGTTRFFVTSDPERFAAVGSLCLQTTISPKAVTVTTLGG